MTTYAATAFDQPPRGFSGLSERIQERDIVVRIDERCPMCGGADPLQLACCLSCMSRSGERLIYLRRPRGHAQRRENIATVRSLMPPDTPTLEVELVADGCLAFASVPTRALGTVEAALVQRGLAVRSTSARWSVASTPTSLGVCVLAVLLLGPVAEMWWGIPYLRLGGIAPAFGLWLIGQVLLHRPVVDDPNRGGWLESQDEEAVVHALAGRLQGRAKRAFVEVVRTGRLLHARAKMVGDDNVADDVGALLALSAEVAVDLTSADELADALRRGGRVGRRAEVRESIRRLDESSLRLEQLLHDAHGCLSGANRRVLAERGFTGRLNFLVHEIDRGRAEHLGLCTEVGDLLDGVPRA